MQIYHSKHSSMVLLIHFPYFDRLIAFKRIFLLESNQIKMNDSIANVFIDAMHNMFFIQWSLLPKHFLTFLLSPTVHVIYAFTQLYHNYVTGLSHVHSAHERFRFLFFNANIYNVLSGCAHNKHGWRFVFDFFSFSNHEYENRDQKMFQFAYDLKMV